MTPAMNAESVSARMTPRRLSGMMSPRPEAISQATPGADFHAEVSIRLQASAEKRRASAMQIPALSKAVRRLSVQQTDKVKAAVRRLSASPSAPVETAIDGDAPQASEADDNAKRQVRQLADAAAKRKRKSILAAAEVLATADGEDIEDAGTTVEEHCQ